MEVGWLEQMVRIVNAKDDDLVTYGRGLDLTASQFYTRQTSFFGSNKQSFLQFSYHDIITLRHHQIWWQWKLMKLTPGSISTKWGLLLQPCLGAWCTILPPNCLARQLKPVAWTPCRSLLVLFPDFFPFPLGRGMAIVILFVNLFSCLEVWNYWTFVALLYGSRVYDFTCESCT